MRRLLSLFGAVGLTITSAATVISCSWNDPEPLDKNISNWGSDLGQTPIYNVFQDMDVIQNISLGERGYYESFTEHNLKGPIFKWENDKPVYPSLPEIFKDDTYNKYCVDDIIPSMIWYNEKNLDTFENKEQIMGNFNFEFGYAGNDGEKATWSPLPEENGLHYIKVDDTSNQGQNTAAVKGGRFKVKITIEDGTPEILEDGTKRTYTKNGGFYFEGDTESEIIFIPIEYYLPTFW